MSTLTNIADFHLNAEITTSTTFCKVVYFNVDIRIHTAHFQLGSFLIGLVSNRAQL